jgi:hypothetical protein
VVRDSVRFCAGIMFVARPFSKRLMRLDRLGEVELMCYSILRRYQPSSNREDRTLQLRYAKEELGTCQVLSQDRDYAAVAVVWSPMLKILAGLYCQDALYLSFSILISYLISYMPLFWPWSYSKESRVLESHTAMQA